MNQESKLREEICRIGASLYQRGYTVGSAGNISARLDDGWLITPTDACLGMIDPAAVARVSANGDWVSGDKPSKTLTLHRAIYDNNPEAKAVVHTHSTHLVALTLAGAWLADDIVPPLTPYYVMKVGHIPMIPYHRPGDPAVAARVATLAAKVRGVMLERLGPVVWESSVSRAAFALEELEETAKLWMMMKDVPGFAARAALSDSALAELRDTFQARW